MKLQIVEDDYQTFLASKEKRVEPVGFDVPIDKINPQLSEWQRHVVRWAVKRGRAALFEDCGLGKTPQQLEWARLVHEHTGRPILILAPPAVAIQTAQIEAPKFGIHNAIRSRTGEISAITVTNYERLHYYKPEDFAGIVLDESSILKSFDGSTRKEITEFARSIHYRLACTATPAPNDLIELTNHAEFLDVMSGKEIIALFFKQDGNTTHAWRLKHHAEDAFWKWMAEWSIAMRKPSDIGFSDDGYILPSLIYHDVQVDGGVLAGEMFAVEASDLMERKRARRESLSARVRAAADIANGTDEQVLIFCDLNSESESLTRQIRGAVQVTGSDSPEYKEETLIAFAQGKIRVLVTKPTIAGFGLNLQNCHNMIFVGLSDSYEQFYQGVRREWRFGQLSEVHCWIVTATTEGAVVRNIQRKEAQAQAMFDGIVKHMRIYETITAQRRDSMEYKVSTVGGDGWTLMLGDSCERIKEISSNSIGFSIFSPPFPGMYAYTNSARDIGNTTGIDEMIEHFRFIMPELLRITMPGRNCSVHLMQLTSMKSREGFIGLKDYRGRIIAAMEESGWRYAGEVCIDKNPQVQATRNKERGLLFKTLATDSSMMRMALADYLLQFRKDGDNPVPIRAGLSQRYNNPDGWITEAEWIEWASPVWYRRVDKSSEGKRDTGGYPGLLQHTDGIQETDVLNNYRMGKDEDDEKHLAPLQLGVIERAIKLWSAPGDTVFSPFAGIGSEGYEAVKLKRKFVGIELKDSYFDVAVSNLKDAERQSKTTDAPLFAELES